ncbi:hypothetical protein RD792_011300 [Penstemon davidsonii]|uniref:NPH3 domain-containing protein n=1 Tax=Penstemon davidsonii TaxID=160366 RepID=A0ABR0D475_9LAMI|nr:hypothetical protein RD792_011300 [Penstemon davidsonii]
MITQEKQKTWRIEIDEFPGGPDGFELISRFCYNNGTISITVSNVCLLHCCAVFLEMTEKKESLLHQTQVFLEGIFYWSWNEIITCLKNCDLFFSYADSYGLIDKLLCSLLAKIAQNSDLNFLSVSSSPSSSSPDTITSSTISRKAAWAWWFQDLNILSPKIIQHFLKALGAYGNDNNNLVLTKFLLQYLKTSSLHLKNTTVQKHEYEGLADTVVHGVVLMGKSSFSCRGLFWVLRIVSGFGISKERRAELERLIGGMLDQATLDDLLVSSRGGGGGNGGVYDVNLVIRLIRLFVQYYNEEVSFEKLKKVGELVDMYLGEIGPDSNLKISKFLGVAESLPDCARDSFDQVYGAIDSYLQSHPALSLEERSRLCRCLNYEKLSLEACKDLAKNPRIPPRIAIQALSSQHSNIQIIDDDEDINNNNCQLVLYDHHKLNTEEHMKVNLERMQSRVVELEKVCREMKGQMRKMVKIAPQHTRLC